MNTVKTELQTTPLLLNSLGVYIKDKKEDLRVMMKSKAGIITSIMSMGRRSIYTLLVVFVVYSILKFK